MVDTEMADAEVERSVPPTEDGDDWDVANAEELPTEDDDPADDGPEESIDTEDEELPDEVTITKHRSL